MPAHARLVPPTCYTADGRVSRWREPELASDAGVARRLRGQDVFAAAPARDWAVAPAYSVVEPQSDADA